jgi:hypothetical protein
LSIIQFNPFNKGLNICPIHNQMKRIYVFLFVNPNSNRQKIKLHFFCCFFFELFFDLFFDLFFVFKAEECIIFLCFFFYFLRNFIYFVVKNEIGKCCAFFTVLHIFFLFHLLWSWRFFVGLHFLNLHGSFFFFLRIIVRFM